MGKSATQVPKLSAMKHLSVKKLQKAYITTIFFEK